MPCLNCGQESQFTGTICPMCGKPYSGGIASFPRNTSYGEPNNGIKQSSIASRLIFILIVAAAIHFGRAFLTESTWTSSDVWDPDAPAIAEKEQGWDSYNAGDAKTALEHFEKAADKAVTTEMQIMTQSDLGTFYVVANRNEEALIAFKKVQQLSTPKSYDYYFATGKIAQINHQIDDALKNFLAAYKLEPEDTSINLILARMYLNLSDRAPGYEDLEKGLTFAQRAYEYDLEKTEPIKHTLILGYALNEKYDDAIALLKTSNFVTNPWSAYFLGAMYIEKGDMDSARTYFVLAQNYGYSLPTEIKEWLQE